MDKIIREKLYYREKESQKNKLKQLIPYRRRAVAISKENLIASLKSNSINKGTLGADPEDTRRKSMPNF